MWGRPSQPGVMPVLVHAAGRVAARKQEEGWRQTCLCPAAAETVPGAPSSPPLAAQSQGSPAARLFSAPCMSACWTAWCPSPSSRKTSPMNVLVAFADPAWRGLLHSGRWETDASGLLAGEGTGDATAAARMPGSSSSNDLASTAAGHLHRLQCHHCGQHGHCATREFECGRDGRVGAQALYLTVAGCCSETD